MAETFYPMLGDFYLIGKNVQENKPALYHYIEETPKHTDKDLRIVQFGCDLHFNCISVKAFDEFEKALTNIIDRYDQRGMLIANLTPGSLSTVRTHDDYKQRRKHMSSAIGINQCSKYINMMIKAIDDSLSKVSENQEIDFTMVIKEATLAIIITIFFGYNISEKIGKIKYICPNTNETSYISFERMYVNVTSNELAAQFSAKGKLLPFLQHWKLINPFKSNAANALELARVMREYLSKGEDKDCIYQQLMSLGKFDKEAILMDCILMMIAGYDTVAHSLTSVLHFLKKNPDKMEKLNKELEKSGLHNIEGKSGKDLMKAYMECDYLTYVGKESLRLDAPVMQSVMYEIYQDTEICGVKLEKGQHI